MVTVTSGIWKVHGCRVRRERSLKAAVQSHEQLSHDAYSATQELIAASGITEGTFSRWLKVSNAGAASKDLRLMLPSLQARKGALQSFEQAKRDQAIDS